MTRSSRHSWRQHMARRHRRLQLEPLEDRRLLADLRWDRLDNLLPPQGEPPPFAVSISPVGSKAEAGSHILLEGRISAEPSVDLRQIGISINNQNVIAYDANGRFFTTVDIQPGTNQFKLMASDGQNDSLVQTITIIGEQNATTSGYVDVTASFEGIHRLTSSSRDGRTTNVTLASKNAGAFAIDVPLLVGVRNISDPTVQLTDTDGTLPDGTAYYDFSSFAANGRLAPENQTAPKSISFHNANRVSFTYDLVFYGKLNSPPVFDSVPIVTASADRLYRYDAAATDADSDALSFSLETGPSGMAIEPATGLLHWTPTLAQIGVHDVSLLVSDGRGGTARQHFSLSVTPAPPNRPPIITSTPVVSATLGAAEVATHNLLQNPSFEDYSVPSSQWTLPGIANHNLQAGDISIQGWTVVGEPLDYVVGWQAADGNASIDLAGNPGFGGIEQTVATIPGRTYLLRFSLSGNPDPSPLYSAESKEKRVQVTLGDEQRVFAYNVEASNNSFSAMKWQDESLTFVAQSTRSTVRFRNTSSAIYTGPVIDNLSLTLLSEQHYQYDVEALDPDDDPIEYLLATMPPGMQIDHYSGLITWEPTIQQVGNHHVVVQAIDDLGGVATQEFTICVLPDPQNHAPIIVSETPVGAVVRQNNAIQSAPLDLSTWSVVQYEDNYQPNANWTIGAIHTQTSQIVDADPSILLSAINLRNDAVEGTWRASSSPDDDFFGFVFGYQDSGHFYVFDWKQGNQTHRGFAEKGMSIKVVNADGSISGTDLWPTVGNGARVRTIAHNTISWQNNTDYRFRLEFQSGQFQIVIMQANSIVASFKLSDSTFESGRFGLYNYSQANVTYSDIRHEKLPETQFAHRLRAVDPDNDSLTFKLLSGPPGATVDPATGQIAWLVNSTKLGRHDFTVRVEDGRGGFDEQSFAINVTQTSGEIRGMKFNDLNGNGIRDHLDSLAFYADPTIFAGWSATNLAVDFEGISPVNTEIFDPLVVGGITFEQGDTGPRFSPNLVVCDTSCSTSFGTPLTSNVLTVTGNENFDITFPTAPTAISFDSYTNFSNSKPIVSVFDTSGNVLGAYLLTQPVNSKGFIGIVSPVPIGRIHWLADQGESVNTGIDNIRIGTAAAVEPGIEGWSIYLDQDQNGRRSDEERFTTTDSQGNYTFSGLSPGNYYVAEESRTGWRQTSPATNSRTITIAGSSVISGADFGNTQVMVPGNQDPEILSDAPRDAVAGDLLKYFTIVRDPNNDPISFDLPVTLPGMTIHPSLGILAWQPALEQLGKHAVVIRARDTHGGVALQSFDINVVRPNTAPIMISDPLTRAVVGRPFEYHVRAVDADGDVLTFISLSMPAGMSLDASIGKLTWTPTTGQVGSQAIALKVSDGRGGESTQSFAINVLATAPNASPVITSSPPSEVFQPSGFYYAVAATDSDGDPLTFHLDQPPAGMNISPIGVLTWQPTPAQLRDHTVKLRVTDGQGGEDTQSFTLHVGLADQNHAPTITSNPPHTVTLGRTFAYDASAIDEDGDAYVWSLEAAPIGMSVDAITGQLRWQPRADQLGDYEVVLRVEDSLLGIARQRFEVSACCHNFPPAIVSVPPTQAVVALPYLYSVRAQDADGDALHYSLNAAPVGMTIDSATGLVRWKPTVAQLATHTVIVRAVDSTGDFGLQTFQIKVGLPTDKSDPGNPNSPPLGNRSPLITSTPKFTAEVETSYRYAVQAFDPDGDAFSFELSQSAPGMTIDAGGVVHWTPSAAAAGLPFLVNVVVRDARNATASQSYVVVAQPNAPPQIISQPVLTVFVGNTYRYDVRATDPNGDTLSYSFDPDRHPAGMTIDSLGRILWNATSADTGPHSVTVIVTDSHGAPADQAYQLTVQADTLPPAIDLQVIEGRLLRLDEEVVVDLNTTLQFRVLASDNVGVAARTLAIGTEQLALDTNGTATQRVSQLGLFQIVATASDGAGNSTTVTRRLRVIDPADIDGPYVRITSPADSETAPETTVTYLAPIIGTVDDPDDQLEYWKVYIASVSAVDIDHIDITNPNYRLINEGTTEVINGSLGTFDPTLLQNDQYVVVVAAFDTNGQGTLRGILINVEGNAKLGNFRLEFTDLTIPLAGIPIQINRIYDTLQANEQGSFGYGWTLGIMDGKIRETVPDNRGDFFTAFPYKIGTRVYITTPEEKRVGFTFQPDLRGTLFGTQARPKFVADPGVYERLEDADSHDFAWQLNADSTVSGFVGIGAYNPENFVLTTRDGNRYLYNQYSGLQRAVDPSGNILTFTRNGIYQAGIEVVQLKRDHLGRITNIVDPAQQELVYTYDAFGNLASFTNQASLTTRYEYLSQPQHFLEKIFDSLGREVFRADFDTNGRLSSTFDALGAQVQQDFDPSTFTGTITDARGNVTTLLYNERGNVVRETDPLGNSKFMEYADPNNPDLETRVIDRNGNITDRQYDSRGNIAKIIERGGPNAPVASPIVSSFAYDAGNHVTSITNALGKATLFAYDATGNVTRITNALGDSSFFTYDALGRKQTYTDFNGNMTTFEHLAGCACGAPSKVIFADQTYQTFTYNRFGQVTSEKWFEADGTLGESKLTEYDAIGRVNKEVNGVGDVTRKYYSGNVLDWEIVINRDSLAPDGTLLESPATPVTQRKSRITDYEYDANNRITRIVNPDGTSVQLGYDVAGNWTTFVDQRGATSIYFYDKTNRIYEISTTSAQGITTVKATEYDHNGQVISEIDETNNRTEYKYDAFGRLVAVIDAALQETQYRYDATGNRVSQRDANGNLTQYRFDSIGRRIETIMPTGNIARVEYDAMGNVIKSIDFNGSGIVQAYTKRNQLSDVLHPDGERTHYAYSATGKEVSAANASSVITRRFDLAGRLLSLSNSDGGMVSLQYDSFGNRISVATTVPTHLPRTTFYSYDIMNNLKSVVDPDGSATYYTYDEAGSVTRISRPNGTLDEWKYDGLGRPVGNTSRLLATDEVLQSFDYLLDGAGYPLEISSEDSPHVVYSYDALHRLVGEDVGVAGSEDSYTIVYEYDSVGNRISRRHSSDGLTSYEYDANNRLLRTTNANGGEAYQYDNNGNLILRSSPSGASRYRWGFQGKLIAVDMDDNGDFETEFEYDGDGNRISVSRMGLATRFLVDDSLSASRVLEEYDGDNRQLKSFSYGSQLLSQYSHEDAVLVFCHLDRLGSVTLLSNQHGEIAGRFSYDAFGVMTRAEGLATSSRTFGGEQFDESTGLYYLRARYLDPAIGRFVSRDPSEGRSDQPLTFNGYSYTENRPTRFVDPSGRTSIAIEYSQSLTPAITAHAAAFSIGLAASCTLVFAGGSIASVAGVDIYESSLPPVLRNCLPAQMRVQLQSGKYTPASAVTAPTPPTVGVSVRQFQETLMELWIEGRQELPSRLEWMFRSAIIETSIWANGVPPHGIIGDHKNVHREEFDVWRVDTENLRGWNLRRIL